MDFTFSQQIKVGAFVLAGIILICVAVIFLGEGQMILTDSIYMRVRLKQVSGLNQGSQVTLSGLRIGKIEKIDLASDNTDLIATLRLESKYAPRLTEGSKVSLRTLGALGDKYILVEPGPIDAKPLPENSFINTDQEDDLIDVISKRGSEMANIVDVINELNILLKNLNQNGRSAHLVDRLILVSDNLNKFLIEAKDGLHDAKNENLVKNLSSIVNKINRGEGTLGTLINDPSLHQKLMGILGDSPRRQFLKPLIRDSIKEQEKSGKGGK